MDKPRVKVPKKVKKGEPFEVKALISHKMESGQRTNKDTGEKIPRQIINRFSCKLNGEEVFGADFHAAVSANPYMAFYVRADADGELEFLWVDDSGDSATTKKSFKVE